MAIGIMILKGAIGVAVMVGGLVLLSRIYWKWMS